MRTIANIFWLGTKEIRSFMRDFVLVALVIYTFSLAVIAQAQSNSQELHNASIAFVDEDHSDIPSSSTYRRISKSMSSAAATPRFKSTSTRPRWYRRVWDRIMPSKSS